METTCSGDLTVNLEVNGTIIGPFEGRVNSVFPIDFQLYYLHVKMEFCSLPIRKAESGGSDDNDSELPTNAMFMRVKHEVTLDKRGLPPSGSSMAEDTGATAGSETRVQREQYPSNGAMAGSTGATAGGETGGQREQDPSNGTTAEGTGATAGGETGGQIRPSYRDRITQFVPFESYQDTGLDSGDDPPSYGSLTGTTQTSSTNLLGLGPIARRRARPRVHEDLVISCRRCNTVVKRRSQGEGELGEESENEVRIYCPGSCNRDWGVREIQREQERGRTGGTRGTRGTSGTGRTGRTGGTRRTGGTGGTVGTGGIGGTGGIEGTGGTGLSEQAREP